MPKNRYHTEVERAQIVTLHQHGLSQRQISKDLGISRASVQRTIKKFLLEGIYGNRKKSGRPRKTSQRDDHTMKKIVARSPTSSCKKIRSNLLENGVDISLSTVSRRLSKEFGLISRKPAKKPKLTTRMMKKRFEFARNHIHWTVDDWGKVLFSNESTFQQFVVRHKHVRRPVGKRFHPKYTIPTMKHPPSQMIWGAMSKNGTAGLYFLTPGTTMNGSKYVELLKNKLLVHMNVHNTIIFMQDGAPCHRSKIVKKFLEENHVTTLDWPVNSPDLNPIENLWAKMKDLVAEKQPSNGKALNQCIKVVWVQEISENYCNSLIESMPHRLQAMIDAKGGHTKY